MFDLSAVQIILVLVIALLVFGPKRLPELGRQLGKGLHDLRRHAGSFTQELSKSPVEDDDPRGPATVPRERQAPEVPRPAGEEPEDLLEGVLIPHGTAADAAAGAAADAEDDASLLDGVVVPGSTPPGSSPGV